MLVRISLVAAVISLGSGCGYYWELREGIETACPDPHLYYMDSDGDGWGAADDPIVACEGDAYSGYVVENGLDCDDENKFVTGKIGSICPQGMVAGGVDVTGVVYDGSEYIAVHSSTALVTASTAEIACGALGWGGALASFDTSTEMYQVTAQLEQAGVTDEYAAFVNAGATDDRTGWKWLDDSGFDFAEEGWCLGITPTPTDYAVKSSKSYESTIDAARLALVVRNGLWCFGSPDQAYGFNSALDLYGPKKGHFICEREEPTPPVYGDDSVGSTTESDTGT